jgi:uncharacterized protein
MHAHVFPDKIAEKAAQGISEFYGIPRRYGGTLDELKNSAKEGGVDRLIICSVATTPHQVIAANDYAFSCTGEGVWAFGTLHPDYPEPQSEIARIKAMGLLGVKLHPDFQQFDLDDPKMDRIYSELSGYPLLLHIGDERYDYSAPERLARVMDRFPGLVVIAAHLGGYSKWENNCLLGRELYIDTSSALWAMTPGQAGEIIQLHGVDKVLFGTDYPLASHIDELAMLKKLGLNPEEEQAILYGNAARLFNIQ